MNGNGDCKTIANFLRCWILWGNLKVLRRPITCLRNIAVRMLLFLDSKLSHCGNQNKMHVKRKQHGFAFVSLLWNANIA